MTSPCNDAYDKVHGERGEDYGHPLDDFATTAALLSALGFRRLDRDGTLRELAPTDISVQQRMVKESRRYTTPNHYDSLVDIPGYAETEQMVIEELQARSAMVPEDEWVYSRETHKAVLESFSEAPVPRPEDYDKREV